MGRQRIKPFANGQEIRPKDGYCFEKPFSADELLSFISTQGDVRASLTLGYYILPFQGENPTNPVAHKAFPHLGGTGRGLYSLGNT